jgi:hypothetical protein
MFVFMFFDNFDMLMSKIKKKYLEKKKQFDAFFSKKHFSKAPCTIISNTH